MQTKEEREHIFKSQRVPFWAKVWIKTRFPGVLIGFVLEDLEISKTEKKRHLLLCNEVKFHTKYTPNSKVQLPDPLLTALTSQSAVRAPFFIERKITFWNLWRSSWQASHHWKYSNRKVSFSEIEWRVCGLMSRSYESIF